MGDEKSHVSSIHHPRESSHGVLDLLLLLQLSWLPRNLDNTVDNQSLSLHGIKPEFIICVKWLLSKAACKDFINGFDRIQGNDN